MIAIGSGGRTGALGIGSVGSNDTTILNFALFLEHLEADFYSINVPRLFM